MNIPVDTTYVAAYNPSPVDFGSISQETSSVTTVLEITGGQLPYTIVSVIFLGGAPAAGVSLTLTTTDVTDDTVAITTTAATPPASYMGTIRARVDNGLGQSLTVDVDYDFVELAVFDDITAFLDSLSITHRWRLDEVSGVAADTGNGTTRDMDTTVGTVFYEQGGPDDSTEAINFGNSSSFMRNSFGGIDSAATGTVLFFAIDAGTGSVVINHCNTVNEHFNLQFPARSPSGSGVPGTSAQGYAIFEDNNFDKRANWGADDHSAKNADGQWHLYAYVQEGIGASARLYVDGVEDTGPISTATVGGGPPPLDGWFDILQDAGSRVVLGNGRFVGGSGNNTRTASEICVLNGVIMDSIQLTALFDLITN